MQGYADGFCAGWCFGCFLVSLMGAVALYKKAKREARQAAELDAFIRSVQSGQAGHLVTVEKHFVFGGEAANKGEAN